MQFLTQICFILINFFFVRIYKNFQQIIASVLVYNFSCLDLIEYEAAKISPYPAYLCASAVTGRTGISQRARL